MPIVEPEVLMDGSHTIGRCEDVTANVLHVVKACRPETLEKSASLTNGHFRIRLPRLGMGERIISQLGSEPFYRCARSR